MPFSPIQQVFGIGLPQGDPGGPPQAATKAITLLPSTVGPTKLPQLAAESLT